MVKCIKLKKKSYYTFKTCKQLRRPSTSDQLRKPVQRTHTVDTTCGNYNSQYAPRSIAPTVT